MVLASRNSQSTGQGRYVNKSMQSSVSEKSSKGPEEEPRQSWKSGAMPSYKEYMRGPGLQINGILSDREDFRCKSSATVHHRSGEMATL